MKDKITLGARIILGLIFTVFGFAGLFQLLPQPELGPDAMMFMQGLAATGYFFPLLKITEIVAGLMLLSNRFVPLALILLAPITVNIFMMHLFVALDGLPMAVLIVVLQAYLAYGYRNYFRPVLVQKTVAGAADKKLP